MNMKEKLDVPASSHLRTRMGSQFLNKERRRIAMAIICLLCGCLMVYISAIEFLRAYIIFYGSETTGDVSNELIILYDSHSSGLNISDSHVVCRSLTAEAIARSLKERLESPYFSHGVSCVCEVSYLEHKGDARKSLLMFWDWIMSVRISSEDDTMLNIGRATGVEERAKKIRRFMTYGFPMASCYALVQCHLFMSYTCTFTGFVWLALALFYGYGNRTNRISTWKKLTGGHREKIETIA